jgi:excisionase family DNA binding protein
MGETAVGEVRVLEREEPVFYTIASLAQRLALGERTIRNYVESGEIPSYKFGRARRIDPQDVDSWLARRRQDRRAA